MTVSVQTEVLNAGSKLHSFFASTESGLQRGKSLFEDLCHDIFDFSTFKCAASFHPCSQCFRDLDVQSHHVLFSTADKAIKRGSIRGADGGLLARPLTPARLFLRHVCDSPSHLVLTPRKGPGSRPTESGSLQPQLPLGLSPVPSFRVGPLLHTPDGYG